MSSGLTSLVAALGMARPVVPQNAPPPPSVVDPICKLPGDPSLVLHTSQLIADKPELLKKLSKAVAASLNKPEQYVAVAIHDGVAMCFGGSTDPCAVGCAYSIGAINLENNKALSASVSELLLAACDIPSDRIYINVFDVPRENCLWSGRTFAG